MLHGGRLAGGGRRNAVVRPDGPDLPSTTWADHASPTSTVATSPARIVRHTEQVLFACIAVAASGTQPSSAHAGQCAIAVKADSAAAAPTRAAGSFWTLLIRAQTVAFVGSGGTMGVEGAGGDGIPISLGTPRTGVCTADGADTSDSRKCIGGSAERSREIAMLGIVKL